MPQPRRADIPALVRRLQGGSSAEREQAAAALLRLHERDADSRRTIDAAVASADSIAALLQLISDERSVTAVCLLGNAATLSAVRSQAIEAGGVAVLLRCLESSRQAAALSAAVLCALGNITADAEGHTDVACKAGRAAVEAASGIPAAVRHLGSSDDRVLLHAAQVLHHMADSPKRRDAVAAAIAPLVRLLRHRSRDLATEATAALVNILVEEDSNPQGCAARAAEIKAAGGIPPLVQLIASSSDASTVETAVRALYAMLKLTLHPSFTAQIIEAGGLAALVRSLRVERFGSGAHEQAAGCLTLLHALSGAELSRAFVDAGGAHALVQALGRPSCSAPGKIALASALQSLLLNGQAAAVAAADPTDVATPALESLPSSPGCAFDSPQERAKLAHVLRLLAAARVCAAPGCGATSGLKRCAGCGSVRYCGEACMRAHWKEHRPECKRLRAEATAAAAAGRAGPSTSRQR